MNLKSLNSSPISGVFAAVANVSKLNGRKIACGIVLLLTTSATPLPAQTFTSLHSFNYNVDGASPQAGLVQSTNGNLYGITLGGGSEGTGTVFNITTGGTLTTLFGSCFASGCDSGEYGYLGLVQATNGDLYGTTEEGGAGPCIISATDYGCGTVFKITPSGTLTTLYSFCSRSGCTDGQNPESALFLSTNGDFYGTTFHGGKSGTLSAGTVFRITPSGTLTTLYSFCTKTDCRDGGGPYGALVQASNGDFYGTTVAGGAYNYGTVFKITPAGALTTLYSFCSQNGCADGFNPQAALIQATDGNFYGTTIEGGTSNNGTVFKITPTGVLTTFYSFCSQSGCADGSEPQSALIQATDGNFYGTTRFGGTNNYGTVFKLTPSGTLTALHSFDDVDGAQPFAALIQSTNGTFYGTTLVGGAYALPTGYGTIFSLSVGLEPFVALQTTSGKEGAKIGILGQGFSSSSVVKFGGTQATTITRTGSTFINATVPAGARTGSVTVTTGSTALISSQIFKVTPGGVSFSPPSGPVGTPVTITGTGLAQATKVTFNGKSASFTPTSDTQISTSVPTGATTGKIKVTTPGGSATSATSFTVN
jgi:uncharacterized repeat protein (TIGR03803 family)